MTVFLPRLKQLHATFCHSWSCSSFHVWVLAPWSNRRAASWSLFYHSAVFMSTKIFYQVLDKVSLVYCILLVLADISSALFVIKLLQCANVNTLNCPRWHPRCSQSILNHIILRDISSVRVHLISEGTNLKIGKWYSEVLISRVPGHTQGAEVSQLVTR